MYRNHMAFIWTAFFGLLNADLVPGRANFEATTMYSLTDSVRIKITYPFTYPLENVTMHLISDEFDFSNCSLVFHNATKTEPQYVFADLKNSTVSQSVKSGHYFRIYFMMTVAKGTWSGCSGLTYFNIKYLEPKYECVVYADPHVQPILHNVSLPLPPDDIPSLTNYRFEINPVFGLKPNNAFLIWESKNILIQAKGAVNGRGAPGGYWMNAMAICFKGTCWNYDITTVKSYTEQCNPSTITNPAVFNITHDYGRILHPGFTGKNGFNGMINPLRDQCAMNETSFKNSYDRSGGFVVNLPDGTRIVVWVMKDYKIIDQIRIFFPSTPYNVYDGVCTVIPNNHLYTPNTIESEQNIFLQSSNVKRIPFVIPLNTCPKENDIRSKACPVLTTTKSTTYVATNTVSSRSSITNSVVQSRSSVFSTTTTNQAYYSITTNSVHSSGVPKSTPGSKSSTATGYKSTPGSKSSTSSGYKSTPGSKSSTATGYKSTPGSKSSTTAGYNSTPGLKSSSTTGYKSTPGSKASSSIDYRTTPTSKASRTTGYKSTTDGSSGYTSSYIQSNTPIPGSSSTQDSNTGYTSSSPSGTTAVEDGTYSSPTNTMGPKSSSYPNTPGFPDPSGPALGGPSGPSSGNPDYGSSQTTSFNSAGKGAYISIFTLFLSFFILITA